MSIKIPGNLCVLRDSAVKSNLVLWTLSDMPCDSKGFFTAADAEVNAPAYDAFGEAQR